MDEQTPIDPQQPDHDASRSTGDDVGANDPAPRDPARPAGASDPTARIEAAPAAAPTRGRGVLKPVLIGAAAATTVLAVAVGGLAIADAAGDDDAPGAEATSSAPADDSDAAGAPDASAEPTATAVPSATPEPTASSTERASGEPADLVAAIEAAIAAAGGGAATAVEVDGDAWKVDVRLGDGSELDVRVPVTGEPVVQAEDDDRSSDLALDLARIPDISAAAIAAAGGGEVRSIETDDDEVRFEVEVVLGDEEIDVDLADDLAVLAVDR